MTDPPDGGVPLGWWLRQQREAAGLTQEDLAQRSGMSTRAISDLERGRTRRPYRRSLRLVAAALGLTESACDELVARYRAISRAGAKNGAGTTQSPSSAGTGFGGSSGGEMVPRELPAAIAHFAGRAEELKALDMSLDQVSGNGSAGVIAIAAIGGMAGVGKTALAVHFAHRVAGRFPDGQLYADLRGFGASAEPVPPARVVQGFLDVLGVAPQAVPADPDAQARLYRSVLAGRRMLVVLDNARDAAQVRPLLPGSAGCLVLITSRGQLTGLAATEGAKLVTLGLLPEPEARELVTGRLGAGRVEAEPDAVGELIGLCARLPLALAITAARAAGRPDHPLAALAAELRAAGGPLDALDAGEPPASVRAVFSWSYEQLSPAAARLFRLLGIHPGPDISASAAASLAGAEPARARRLLAELARFHLIAEHAPGRYAFHDLLRAYAGEQARAVDSDSARQAAASRVLDHYLHTAHAGAVLINPSRSSLSIARPQPGVMPERLVGHRQALAWFEAEHRVLLAAAALAAESRYDRHAWQLPWIIWDYLDNRGHWHELAAIQRSALDAAARIGDAGGQAAAHRALAGAYNRFARYDVAREHLAHSLELYHRAGDRAGQVDAHLTLGWMFAYQERYADALGHCEQALGLLQGMGDRAWQARALHLTGRCCAHLGRHRQARASCQRALALLREAGHRPYEAETWHSLGDAEHQSGDHAAAAACYQRALGLFRELGDRHTQATVLAHLGDAQHAAGQTPAARRAWQEAVAILDALHHPDAGKVRARLRKDGPGQALTQQPGAATEPRRAPEPLEAADAS